MGYLRNAGVNAVTSMMQDTLSSHAPSDDLRDLALQAINACRPDHALCELQRLVIVAVPHSTIIKNGIAIFNIARMTDAIVKDQFITGLQKKHQRFADSVVKKGGGRYDMWVNSVPMIISDKPLRLLEVPDDLDLVIFAHQDRIHPIMTGDIPYTIGNQPKGMKAIILEELTKGIEE